MDNEVFLAVNKLMKIQRRHKQMIDTEVAEIGIHRTHHRILMHLARNGNLLSQKELAEHLEITPAAISCALQKLEADNYIERKLGTDNRFNEINITEKGRIVVENTRALFLKVDNSLFDGFSENELSFFISSLEKILANMDKGDKVNEKMV